jgi:tetratricopeptide (TPR) repeat protein
LTLLQELGDRHAEADTWDSLGYAHKHLNQHRRAVECYQQALSLYRSIGDRYYEAATLIRLGETYRSAAHAAWQHSLDILVDLDHPVADGVRSQLENLDRDLVSESWLGPLRPTSAVPNLDDPNAINLAGSGGRRVVQGVAR